MALLLSLAAEIGRRGQRRIKWAGDEKGGRGPDVIALWKDAPGLLSKVDEEAAWGAPKLVGQLDVDVLLIGCSREYGIRLGAAQL